MPAVAWAGVRRDLAMDVYERYLAANPHTAGGYQSRAWCPEEVRPLQLILVCEREEIVSGGAGVALTVLHRDLSDGLPPDRCVARTRRGLVLTCLPGVHWRRKASFAFTTLARSSSACLAVRRLRHHRLPTYQTRSPTPHTTLMASATLIAVSVMQFCDSSKAVTRRSWLCTVPRRVMPWV